MNVPPAAVSAAKQINWQFTIKAHTRAAISNPVSTHQARSVSTIVERKAHTNTTQSRLRPNRPIPIRRRRSIISTLSRRGSKRGRERILRTGEREGETLRREDPPSFALAFSGTFPSCGLPLAGRGRIVPNTQSERAQHLDRQQARRRNPTPNKTPLTPTVSRGSPVTSHSCEAACRRSRDLRTRARVELASDLADSAVRR